MEGTLGKPYRVHHAMRARKNLFLRWIVMAISVGVVTGAFVAGFDYILRDKVISFLYEIHNPWAYLLLPPAGLILAQLVVQYMVPSREGELTEDYIKVYHDTKRHLNPWNLPGKMLASFITLATGGSMGLEGPSIYFGAALGDGLQQKFKKLFRREDLKLLLVAGAAAGLAAIFKTPLTGVVFAMEAPFSETLASRALVPALLSSSSSYITFVLLVGANPLFSHFEVTKMGPWEMVTFLLLGLTCGIGARFFVWLTNRIKKMFAPLSPITRAALGGILLGAVGWITYLVFNEPYVYGPGYKTIGHFLNHASDPLTLVLFLLVAKMFATAFTVGAGGVGGLFFPMAVMGTLVGSGFSHFMPPGTATSLYAIIGLAAFVAAGYRTPLAAITFVAETTGNPWVLIPAMLASVVSYLSMGNHSISDQQRSISTFSFGLSSPR